MKKIDPTLKEQLKKLIVAMGYQLIGGEIIPSGRRNTFRLYIDKEGGVTATDCSHVSHQVSGLLDVQDPFQGRYDLEISSPGIDRPLFEIEHYQQYIGKPVKIRLYSPIDGGQRNLKGFLDHVDGDVIYLLLEKEGPPIKITFSEIEKATLIGEIHF